MIWVGLEWSRVILSGFSVLECFGVFCSMLVWVGVTWGNLEWLVVVWGVLGYVGVV